MISNIEFISAGAGSGKTFALTQKLNEELSAGHVRPKSVIATTFTIKAAKELKDRVRASLIEAKRIDLSEQIELAQIGTVNSICGRLLERFAFEAGIPPEQETLDEAGANILFRKALDQVIRKDQALVSKMNRTAARLSIEDWEQEVKRLVDSARANNIEGNKLRAFANSSSGSLLAYFPKPSSSFDPAGLKKAIARAVSGIQNNIDKNIDTTGVTSKYLAAIKSADIKLSQNRLPWSAWASLGKSLPGAKSKDYGQLVQDAALDFVANPNLHEDVNFFNKQLFDFAASSLESYQTLKAKRGLVDFVDQEQRLFKTLDNLSVQDTLRGELDLLMVDEFQDTSPIQLAVFMKIAKFADKVVFVGDLKQSIYGFRGADPALMTALLENLAALNIDETILPNSWRSRPALVSFVNSIFKDTFATTLREDQIILNPKRKEIENQTAVETWTLEGKTIPDRLSALAQEVKRMIASGKVIFDKKTNAERAAKFKDVAILCRSNSRLTTLAETLSNEEVPCQFVQSGLMQTPEATLALASLRRLIDPSDVLAAAEIHTLSNCESPQVWLPKRLEFLDNPSHKSRDWKIGNSDIFEALETSRDRLKFLTPVETFRLALSKAQVFETVTKWGPTKIRAQQRVSNLNKLVDIAESYEAQCALETDAATVAGLIFHFDQVAYEGLDMKAPSGGEDSVQILTHHRAKGLEWPIVILLDLEAPLRDQVWGPSVLGNPAGIDIDAPLKDRTLRYWPKLFGKNTKGVDVLDKIILGKEAVEAEKLEISELQRLLYVSMTRARDCLVFAIPNKKTPKFPWAETLGAGHFWPEGRDEKPLLTDNLTRHTLVEAEEAMVVSPKTYLPEVIQFAFQNENISARLSPSSFPALPTAKVVEVIELGPRMKIHETYNETEMGNALHGIIAAHLMGQKSTETILKVHEVDTAILSADALEVAKRLESFISEQFGECTLHCEYPIKNKNGKGQTISGWIDLILETETSIIIIDHKASPRPRSYWEEIALSYSGQLAAYAEAFSDSNKPIETWIHFAMTGGILKVEC